MKVANCFGIKAKPALDKLKKSLLEHEESKTAVAQFVNEVNLLQAIFVLQTGAETALAQVETPSVEKLKKKCLVLIHTWTSGYGTPEALHLELVAI